MFMDSHGVFVKVRIFERVVGEVDLAWAVAPAPRDPIWWGQQKQNNLHMFCLPAIHFGSSGHSSLSELVRTKKIPALHVPTGLVS